MWPHEMGMQDCKNDCLSNTPRLWLIESGQQGALSLPGILPTSRLGPRSPRVRPRWAHSLLCDFGQVTSLS